MKAREGVAVAILSVIVTVAWMWNPGKAPRFDTADIGFHSFREEVYGDAPKGICYRVFFPYLCRAANDLSPWRMEGLADIKPLTEMRLDRSMMPAYVMAGFLSLAGFLSFGFVCGPLALVLLLATIGPYGGLGDPITAGAFAVAIWAIKNNKNAAFIISFAIAALNRETAPLLLVWFALYKKSVWPIPIISILFWAALRGVLAVTYADNDMSMCWREIERNLKLIQPLSMTTAIAYIVGAALVVSGMRQQPDWFRNSFIVGLVLIGGMAVLWSRPERFRTYYELMPMASICFSSGVRWCIAKGR